MQGDSPTYDVAIVGLGPVGCAAAIMLADAGLQVVAFERDPEVYALPRAVMLDGEIVRAFQALGRAEEVEVLRELREAPGLVVARHADRGVHVLFGVFGVDRTTIYIHSCLGFVPELFYGQDTMHI